MHVDLIRKDNPFPTACALICEHPCEARCRRNIIDDSINIRGMKRYIVDNAPSDQVPVPECASSTGKNIAIIGGGPSGLTAAYFLQLMGHQCTVFEEKQHLGGMLRYGIPNYRFPRERLQEDIDAILSTGVEVKMNQNIGTEEIKEIQKFYDAIYVAIGAHTDKKLGLEGRGQQECRFPLLTCFGRSAMENTRITQVSVLLLSAVETWQWTVRELRSVPMQRL